MGNITNPSSVDIDSGIYGPKTLSSKYYPFGRYENLLDDRFIPASMYTWYKSTHEKSKRVAELAKNPEILGVVKKFIGDDIILWGSHFIHQKPGGVHAWHVDVEHMNWDGVTVWVGLKNLSSRSSVSVMPYTHEFSSSPPLLSSDASNEESNQLVLEAAKKLDSRCELKTFYLEVGDFIVWSGKTWHATINESDLIRHSIILQYCRPDANVRIPITYSYPNTQWSTVKPPCLPIAGNFLHSGICMESYENSSYVNEVLRAIFVLKGRLMQLARLIIQGHS